MSSPADRRNPVLGLVAALLPSPERDRFAVRFDAEPYFWSLALGLFELFLGTATRIGCATRVRTR
jgi:hypothetical protein